MRNNYDLIAYVYDPLSKMVFFNAQRSAQINQLKYILPGSTILIVGGGTGWILEEINKLFPDGLTIIYLELSSVMIRIAKKRKTGKQIISYINSDAIDFETLHKFDAILTGFLFDNFFEEEAVQIFTHLNKLIKPQGMWLYSDFQSVLSKQRFWHKILLNLMYTFFKYVSGIKVNKIPSIITIFNEYGYQELKCKLYYLGFIQSIIYIKT